MCQVSCQSDTCIQAHEQISIKHDKYNTQSILDLYATLACTLALVTRESLRDKFQSTKTRNEIVSNKT